MPGNNPEESIQHSALVGLFDKLYTTLCFFQSFMKDFSGLSSIYLIMEQMLVCWVSIHVGCSCVHMKVNPVRLVSYPSLFSTDFPS